MTPHQQHATPRVLIMIPDPPARRSYHDTSRSDSPKRALGNIENRLIHPIGPSGKQHFHDLNTNNTQELHKDSIVFEIDTEPSTYA
ncbi:hypothetical protein CGCF415_v015473 [Colletotrichum fructicola]|nr:hypothetical protein CGCFRS4_v014842 [Colletotrichum fructicola]KAF4885135.1 hypothetical protein CGCF415_v015473 [Colletotrichum fructicola]KAF4924988.1 hypothetical protein CGCF245_v014262 [Colletotrichum fructicola]